MQKLVVFLFCLFICVSGFSQTDSSGIFIPSKNLNKQRIFILSGTEVLGYSATMIGLNALWYKDYSNQQFHFFNDNKEWLQMDKLGHATTAYYVGYLGLKAMKWTGVNDNKSLWYGGALGLFFLSSVEVFDGYSQAWGASTGDLIANTSGFLLLAGQQLIWSEQKVLLKFSTHFSDYAQYRPNLLGSTWNEKMLKDYNGQTYWLSANLKALTHLEKIPNWINLAIGYSANGMIGGHENPIVDNDGNALPDFKRYRQYFLSLDVDLTRIKTKNPFLNTVLGTFGFVKFPLPAIEFNNQEGVRGHLLYF